MKYKPISILLMMALLNLAPVAPVQKVSVTSYASCFLRPRPLDERIFPSGDIETRAAARLKAVEPRIIVFKNFPEIAKEYQTMHKLVEKIAVEYEKSGMPLPRILGKTKEGAYLVSPYKFIACFLKDAGVSTADSMLDVGGGDAGLSDFISHYFNIPVTSIEILKLLHDYAVFKRDFLVKNEYLKAGRVTLVNRNFADPDVDFSRYSLIYYFAKGTRRTQELLAKMLTVKKGARILIYGDFEPDIERVLLLHPDFKVVNLKGRIGTESFFEHVPARLYIRVNKTEGLDEFFAKLPTEPIIRGNEPAIEKAKKYVDYLTGIFNFIGKLENVGVYTGEPEPNSWDWWVCHNVKNHIASLRLVVPIPQRPGDNHGEEGERIKNIVASAFEKLCLDAAPIIAVAKTHPFYKEHIMGLDMTKGVDKKASLVPRTDVASYLLRKVFIDSPNAGRNWFLFQEVAARIETVLPKIEAAIGELNMPSPVVLKDSALACASSVLRPMAAAGRGTLTNTDMGTLSALESQTAQDKRIAPAEGPATLANALLELKAALCGGPGPRLDEIRQAAQTGV